MAKALDGSECVADAMTKASKFEFITKESVLPCFGGGLDQLRLNWSKL